MPYGNTNGQTDSVSGRLLVRCYTSSGAQTRADFGFIVFEGSESGSATLGVMHDGQIASLERTQSRIGEVDRDELYYRHSCRNNHRPDSWE